MMSCDDAGVSRVICQPSRLTLFVKANNGFGAFKFGIGVFLKPSCGIAAVSCVTMMSCDDAGVLRVIYRPSRLISFVKASYRFAPV
jgi:hypothetical protein